MRYVPISIVLAGMLAALAGCTAIMGKEASDLSAGEQITLRYVETLRSQASLAGFSLQETDRSGSVATTLQQPVAVAADPFRVYVADRAPTGRIAIFDRGARTLSFITGPTPTVGGIHFVEPSGIAVGDSGIIYVADRLLGRVIGLDRTGSVVQNIGVRGDLASPAALAMDPRTGRLLVADTQGGYIRSYTLLGDPVFEIRGGGKGDELRHPSAVTVDRGGTIYVLDARRHRVVVYDQSGSQQRSFPVKRGGEALPPKLSGIALDTAGHVYVLDSMNSSILIYDQTGTLLRSWGRTGTGRDEFWNPAGIFIDSRDTIYIADQMNARIQVYQYEK